MTQRSQGRSSNRGEEGSCATRASHGKRVPRSHGCQWHTNGFGALNLSLVVFARERAHVFRTVCSPVSSTSQAIAWMPAQGIWLHLMASDSRFATAPPVAAGASEPVVSAARSQALGPMVRVSCERLARVLFAEIVRLDRAYPIVGLTCRPGRRDPAMPVERSRERIWPTVPIYVIEPRLPDGKIEFDSVHNHEAIGQGG